MVADGLYDKERHAVPGPNVILGQHVHAIKSSVIAISGRPVLTTVGAYEVRVFGESNHISLSDLCVNLVMTAGHIIVRLQSLVIKEMRPEDFAVVACSSVHDESTANIVSECASLRQNRLLA